MADYYATEQEIKAAFKRLALIHHPDRPSGNEEIFKLIHKAYKGYNTLDDLTKRRSYNLFSLGNFDGFLQRFVQQQLFFNLVEDPCQYDHYTYINQLLNLEGNKQFTIGQDIINYDDLLERLSYVDHIIEKESNRLSKHHPKPTAKMQAQIKKINLNSKKIGAILSVFNTTKQKLLYDLSFDIDHTDEMRQIAHLIGGTPRLIQYIQEEPEIHATQGIFALRDANCLTPANFNQLLQCENEILPMSIILGELLSVNLLTQANFDQLMQNKPYSYDIETGLIRLKLAGILNQQFFDVVMSSGTNALWVGVNISALKNMGILNDSNWQMIVAKIQDCNILLPLLAMKEEGLLTQEQSEVLLWTGPQELSLLNFKIDQMVAHGLFLLSCDVEKGRITMLLGLELKKELKEFFEKSPAEQEAMKEPFKALFITKLHSKDHEMSAHRALWKIIIANIFIAFTGVGLFAIGANFMLNRQYFFAQTTREKQIEAMEKEAWLSPSSYIE